MKATVMIDADYTNTLLIQIEADGNVEALLFDFLNTAKLERDNDNGMLLVRLSNAE